MKPAQPAQSSTRQHGWDCCCRGQNVTPAAVESAVVKYCGGVTFPIAWPHWGLNRGTGAVSCSSGLEQNSPGTRMLQMLTTTSHPVHTLPHILSMPPTTYTHPTTHPAYTTHHLHTPYHTHPAYTTHHLYAPYHTHPAYTTHHLYAPYHTHPVCTTHHTVYTLPHYPRGRPSTTHHVTHHVRGGHCSHPGATGSEVHISPVHKHCSPGDNPPNE
jgi:hypothetical protein